MVAGALLFGCSRTEQAGSLPERPHAPWVFRSVLDSMPRMLTVALHDNLWLAYSAQNGALYKAWKGGVNFDGAVYTTVHGPQPSSIGNAWMENRFAQPWKVVRGGKAERPAIQYRGHRFRDGQVEVNYELRLKDGQVVKVSERPEYMTNEFEQTGLERVFTVEGAPADAELVFETNFGSIPSATSIKTDGKWKAGKVEDVPFDDILAVDVEGELTLNNQGTTRLAAFFVKRPLLENKNKVVGSEAEEELPLGYRLIARSDCKTCHNTYVRTVGPSYVDIATLYRNTPDNVAMLVAKVKNGGSGVWGEAAMTPHHDTPEHDIKAMVSYIMEFDAEQEAAMAAVETSGSVREEDALPGDAEAKESDFLPGVRVKVLDIKPGISSLDEIDFSKAAMAEGIVPTLHIEGEDFGDLAENFALEAEGYLRIPKTNNFTFRLISDDGSRLYIDDQLVINHDGLHGASPMDGEVVLKEGYHPFRVTFFQGAGGRSVSLQWRSFDTNMFEPIPTTVALHHRSKQQLSPKAGSWGGGKIIAGDGAPVAGVHPSFDLSQARPDGFSPKVGGMDFLPDGRLVISTWDAEGAVYVLEGVQTGDPAKMTYKKIASGLAEPLGLKVLDGEIYVLQKQELTHLIDHDGDDVIDEYQTHSNAWRVSANFHEFAFGLAYKKPYFYAALAIAILPGGASANPQIPDRGKAVRIHEETGQLEFVAEGLRTPNGVGIGADGEVFIADNQGDWLPSCKILHVTKGAFFGSRAVDSVRVAAQTVKQPVVWLPQDEIGNSPSTPGWLNVGPYKGQMIHGEVTHGGVKRVFVEKVAGEYQGCVFRFMQGLEAGVNRLVWGPDGALYVGGIGSTGNWQHTGKLWYGLQRLQYNEQTTFEMLAVRAKSDGMEIELTEPLADGLGSLPTDYTVQQWWYKPTHEYGGPKLDQERLNVKSVNISEDRKRIFIELEGLKPQHVVYLRLPNDWTSRNDREIWTTEAWYTLNSIPEGQPGFRRPAPAPAAPNTLSEAERKAGWQLLFDGQTTRGWHNFGKSGIGASWKVADGALFLDAQRHADGHWQAADGGDIVCDKEYENFELRLEWKIAPCGNSGIMYNVVESKDYQYPWQTGPEMQILDNTCHPDATIEKHRAGDLYDMIACNRETVRPAGQWNSVRIIISQGKAEHWLNGRRVVQFELFTPEWQQLIAGSKFREMKGFGQARRGRIALQDHGDPVWFRNIKIKQR